MYKETAKLILYRSFGDHSILSEPVSYTHLDVYKRQVLEEQPSAISQASPLRNDFSFTISLGRISFSTISITAIPAFFASWILSLIHILYRIE